jgi:hypothetical protein
MRPATVNEGYKGGSGLQCIPPTFEDQCEFDEKQSALLSTLAGTVAPLQHFSVL